jgi:predicted heme/steroid binding protein
VHIFSPKDDPKAIQSAVNSAFAVNGGRGNQGQFSDKRFAFLFKPGKYSVDVPVGYYTQVAGMGNSPEDVSFLSAKGVHCQEGGSDVEEGALETFWRIAENFRSYANHSWLPGKKGMLWATSQASPLRRVIVEGDLMLEEDNGYSSGGFVANCNVKGHVMYGSQQQYFTRNSKIGSSSGGVWNMVFAGVEGAPTSNCGRGEGGVPYVTVDDVPVIAEKPFVSFAQDGLYYLNVPTAKRGRRGTDFHVRDLINFNYVKVADPSKDNAESINAALAQGLHVVLSPGIYELDVPLQMVADRQVLLGLGLATLVPTSGGAAIEVGDVDGVRVAGVLIQAGPASSDALLEWGPKDVPRAGDGDYPGFMHDVFVRVGGPAKPETQEARVMVRVNSGHVVGDNVWLWRADHDHAGIVKDGANPCDVGLIVNGDDVAMYGLSAEHSLTDQVQWNGERGATYFFQAELPYDVTEAFGENHFAGYRVGNEVTQHKAYGLGVYHFFRDYPVVVDAGVVAPGHLADSFISPLSVYLNGQGTMKHVFNLQGDATGPESEQVGWWCPRPDDIDTSDDWLPPDPPRLEPETVSDGGATRPESVSPAGSQGPQNAARNIANTILAIVIVVGVAVCVMQRERLLPWLQESSYSLVRQLRTDEADGLPEIRVLSKDMQTRVPGDANAASPSRGRERTSSNVSAGGRRSLPGGRSRDRATSDHSQAGAKPPDVEQASFFTRLPDSFANRDSPQQQPGSPPKGGREFGIW